MSRKCLKPCNECPFLKTSMPGWLGALSDNPTAFLQESEFTLLPCHTRTKYTGKDGRATDEDTKKTPCIGALQFFANSGKYPRGAREKGIYQEVFDNVEPGKSDKIFMWPHEFIQHHSKFQKKTKK